MDSEEGVQPEKYVDVVPDGNIILHIKHVIGSEEKHVSLRCDTTSLSASSKYFSRILLSGRFGEGERVNKQIATLRADFKTFADVPEERLPTLAIEDIGRTSAVKAIDQLLCDFFKILSFRDLSGSFPVANLANLAIVADRFDALDAVAAYVSRKKLIQAIDGKTTAKQDAALSEERLRQRVLVGALLNRAAWVEKYSARLVIEGMGRSLVQDVDVNEVDSVPLWWSLPNRLEDEIAFRRECVLSTIQDLQDHFLKAYASRERQCRLGYDSSPECDSFQFGEMIRFLMKAGTLRLQGTLQSDLDTHDQQQDTYDGNIMQLIEKLKQIPEYQVDRNHSHCGIRTRIVPLLDLIATALMYIGVCGDCWRQSWTKHAWIEAKRPMYWKRQHHGVSRTIDTEHEQRHDLVRALFLAKERDWSS